jgi:hypothetical protein
VERRIVANCAIRVAGRLDAAEAERPEYGYLPPAQRQRATLANATCRARRGTRSSTTLGRGRSRATGTGRG